LKSRFRADDYINLTRYNDLSILFNVQLGHGQVTLNIFEASARWRSAPVRTSRFSH